MFWVNPYAPNLRLLKSNISLALQGGIDGLRMHRKSKTFLLHQKSYTGGNQLYNIHTIALTLLTSISLTVHEA